MSTEEGAGVVDTIMEGYRKILFSARSSSHIGDVEVSDGEEDGMSIGGFQGPWPSLIL